MTWRRLPALLAAALFCAALFPAGATAGDAPGASRTDAPPPGDSPAGATPGGDAGEGGLTAALAPPEARVGQAVTLTLSYTLPPGWRLPSPPRVEGLEGLTVTDRRIREGAIAYTLLVDRLDPWESGGLALVCLDGEGKERRLASGPLALNVRRSAGEGAAELRPLRDIVPGLSPGWWPWAAGGAVLAAAALLLVLFLRRRRRTAAAALEAPHERALRALEELRSRNLPGGGRLKEHYFSLSEILRRYLEEIRGFPAAEYTTEEIARRLENEADRRLLPLLRSADMAKFAGRRPGDARAGEDLAGAIAYVRETAPRGEEAAAPVDDSRTPAAKRSA